MKLSVKVCKTCNIEYSGYKTLCPECGSHLTAEDIVKGVKKKLKKYKRDRNRTFAKEAFGMGIGVIISAPIIFFGIIAIFREFFGFPIYFDVDLGSLTLIGFNIIGLVVFFGSVIYGLFGIIFLITGVIAFLGYPALSQQFGEFFEEIFGNKKQEEE
ncbi:MAG: hypothetical protein HeimC3_40730 [Candidatus Heimdallarchaeota archaeon LC_3]|nr:MAG: hypothetical protein HeimC3_40730 [Candidatus Heimdallarchaeota archaeon LC_3]